MIDLQSGASSMKHRIHLAACLSALALAGVIAVPASANPGLLHKHGARPVGVPAMLPGQLPAGGVAAATTGASAPATAPSSTAVAGVAPGSNGCVVVTGGADVPVVIAAEGLPVGGTLAGGGPAVDPGPFPICDMPPPDGRGRGPEGGPQFWHRLHPGAIGGDPGAINPAVVDSGIVDSGMVMVDGLPAGYCGGVIDVGSVDGAGDMPMVLYTTFLPAGPGGDGAGPGFVHQTMSASMTSAASASTSDVAGGSGRALAGGLPNRAAGVRTDALAIVRHHGHGPVTKPASVAVSGDDSSGHVVQAGGVAEDAAGPVPHDRQAKLAVSNVAGQAVIPPAATAAPRWRDRLRFAWPTTK
jgi:hypothetical protein